MSKFINNDSIICDDDQRLREKSLDVALPLNKEDRELLEGLYKYVLDSTDPEIAQKDNLSPAVGIAAIQTGVKKKMLAVVIKDSEGKIIHEYALANPKILSYSLEEAYLEAGEGCLSVPKYHEGYVYRPRRLKVKAYNLLTDQEEIIKAKDYLAIVLGHEIDHLSGTLYYDHIDQKDPFKVKKDAFCID